MKQLLFIALLMMSASAYAAEAASSSAAPAPGVHKKFEDAKATRLKHISDKIAELQKAQTCVEAATDAKSMKACNSGRRWHRHGKEASTASDAGAASH